MTRLDHELVARGLVRSRTQAKEVLAAGNVLVNDVIQKKASLQVAETSAIALTVEVDQHVSRAAHKLLAAVQEFPSFRAAIAGASAVDVGASTGGFTQVLLEEGAAKVLALDVGHGQLTDSIAQDSRVSNFEGFNIRDVVASDQLPGSPFEIVVSDLSFISLGLALPNMALLLSQNGHLVALIKPQFEVGRERLGRTGVVTSRQQRRESIQKIVTKAHEIRLGVHGLAWSPMVGAHGNHEYLVHLRSQAQPGALPESRLDELIEELLTKEVK